MKNLRIFGIVLFVAILLLIPYVAMKFTSEVNWSAFDFIVAGALLLGTGITCELVLRKVKKTTHRIAFGVAILFAVFIIWAELAVGLIGTPLAGS